MTRHGVFRHDSTPPAGIDRHGAWPCGSAKIRLYHLPITQAWSILFSRGDNAMTRLKTCLSIAFATAALVTVAPQVLAQDAGQIQRDRNCAADDFDCRIARLEARIDYLIDLMEDRSDRGPRRGGGRGQDMVVEQTCTFTSCPQLAAQLCQSAGFGRGVPAEIRNGGPWPVLVRATCSD